MSRRLSAAALAVLFMVAAAAFQPLGGNPVAAAVGGEAPLAPPSPATIAELANRGAGPAVHLGGTQGTPQLLLVLLQADIPGNTVDLTAPPYADLVAGLLGGAGAAAAGSGAAASAGSGVGSGASTAGGASSGSGATSSTPGDAAGPARATSFTPGVDLTDGQVITDAEHTFSGTGNPGDEIFVHLSTATGIGGLSLTGMKVGADGTWSFPTDGLPRPDGTYTVRVGVGDEMFDYTVTYASGTTKVATRDAGVDLTDGQVIKNAEHTFSGTGNPGDEVWVHLSTATGIGGLSLTGMKVGADGTWSFPTDGLPRPDGTYTVRVGVGDQTFDHTVTYSSGTPTVATRDAGVNLTDGQVITDAEHTFTGTGNPGDEVNIFLANEQGANVLSLTGMKVGRDGTWSFPTDGLPREDGGYTVRTFVGDDEFSNKVTYASGLAPAPQPVAGTGTAPAGEVSINVAPGTIFEDKQPVLTGTGSPGDTVEVTFSHPRYGHSFLTVPVDKDGNWVLDLGQQSNLHTLIPGRYTVEVSDPTGAADPVKTTIDFRTPNAQPALLFDNDEDTYQVFTTPAPAFTGTAPPGSTVEVEIKTRDGSTRHQGVAGKDGTWTVDFADLGNIGTFDPGLYTATATVVGTDLPARGHGFEIRSTAPTPQPAVPSFPSNDDVSINVLPGTVFEDKQPVLTGTGNPGDTVEVTISHPRYGHSSLTVPVDKDGNWVLDLGQQSNLHQLIPGRYTVEVSDPMGAEGPIKTTIDFRTPNAQPALLFDHDDERYQVFTTPAPAFTGTAPPGSTVEVEIKTRDGSTRHQGVAGEDGTWTVDFADLGNIGTFDPGLYTATATVVGTDLPARGHGFEIRSTEPTPQPATPSFPSNDDVSINVLPGTVFEDKQPVLTGTGNPGDTVEVHISHPRYGHSWLTVPVDKDGNWVLDLGQQSNLHTLIPGRYTVEVKDPMGAEGPIKTSIDFRTPNAQPALLFDHDDDTYQVFTTPAPAFTGTAPPGSTVRVEIKTNYGSTNHDAVSGPDGTWTVDFADLGNIGTFDPGLYTATATVVGTDLPARGHGFEIKSSAPATVNLLDNPETVASTVEDAATLATNLRNGAAALVGTIRSTGISTGPGAFEAEFFNLGKQAVHLAGDGVVFRPITEEEHAALLDRLGPLLNVAEATGVTTDGGYCLEKSVRPPTAGEMYALANAAKQQEFGAARDIMRASRTLHDAGELNPDSEAESYFHSIRQWAVWVEQEGYPREAFEEAFIDHTRQNAEGAGYQWTADIETMTRGLLPNRYDDIVQVLEAAGIPVPQRP